MNKPTHIAMEGKIYDRKALSPNQLAEIDKQMAKNEKVKQTALKEANKMLQPPSVLKVWAKRLAIGLALTPVGAIGSCMVNNYYQKPPEATESAPVAVPSVSKALDAKTEEEAVKSPEKATKPAWYYAPEDLEKRDQMIIATLMENLPPLLEKVPGFNQPTPFEAKIEGVLFKGLIIIEQTKEKKYILHVLFLGQPCDGKCKQFKFEMHEEIPYKDEIEI